MAGRKGVAMLNTGKATKVTIYLSDGAKHRGIPVYAGVLDFLFREGVAGATVFKGVAGFGAGDLLPTPPIPELAPPAPTHIETVSEAIMIERAQPMLATP